MSNCKYHKPLEIDCDSHTLIWNALEHFRDKDYPDLNIEIDEMQRQLENNIVEEDSK